MGNYWNTFITNSNVLNAVLQDCRFVTHTYKRCFKGTKMQACHQAFLTILYIPHLALGNLPYTIPHLNAQSL